MAPHGCRFRVRRFRPPGFAKDVRDRQFFDPNRRRKACPTVQLLNRRNGKLKRAESLRHILVVDDDPMVCMAIEVYLQRNHFRVTIAEGGEVGLRALEHGQFDLMIIDIFMPHMRGFESIRVFHERAPTIPLIAMSGYAFANLNSPAPDFLRMALKLGAARRLRKPFTPHALRAAINDCLAEHRYDDVASAARLG
ncbi:response regulator [Bradyrhizobium sp. CCBAU 21362]|uniref:response regulator n=1 Tax=Bradyrhizobium sp. CCBAU 21362 TaxID=1325082 RepID=UPI0023064507|nr:response regulator [Bradyrhizobium sp. CCBAU 21362]